MNASEIKKEEKITKSYFPVVGIGTAATEIDILKRIITDLPSDSGMAFIIIENLAARQHSNLTELLLEHSNMPIKEIVNIVDLEPNHIYVIPQNNFLVTEKEELKLEASNRTSKTTNSLDLFFEALGHKYQSYAVGLLLTWSPFDGTAGLKKLKESGGATVSAVSKSGFSLNEKISEFIDYFTTPEETTTKLLEIKNSYLTNHAYEDNDVSASDDTIIDNIIEVIFLKTGTNFHHYKHQTLRRRIAKRMVITKQQTAEKYLGLLKGSVREQELLYNDFLISVTYFFRDQEYFESLSKNVFPALIETMTGKEMRIWSAGCSTGEEVYSLAICLDEYLQQTGNYDITVKIFASDLSEKCIQKARAGVYAIQDLKNIDEKRISKYFTKRDSGYHINKTIRDICVFAVHDLTKDFPFSKIDFISCRNVLIYFNAELQAHVLSSFHYALRDKGFLFLGKAETAQTVHDLFSVVEKQQKIYIRKEKDIHFASKISLKSNNKTNIPLGISSGKTDYKKITAEILLDQYSPAAVLIKEDFEIVHFHGDTSPYLQPPSGQPSFNVISMVHHELRFELKNAILKAWKEKRNFTTSNITVKKQSFFASFEVVYLPSNTDLLLIIFRRKPIIDSLKTKNSNTGHDTETELSLLHDNYRQLSEEQQIYFEELRTTNEELLRRTEELQFLNEELEASTEELLSNNEELSCTNDELQKSRNELSSIRNYYESIVKTIKEPLLIIDKNFMVYSANPAYYKFFNTQEQQTEGFSIFELENSQWNAPEIKESVLNKIRRKETVENVKIEFDLGTGRKKIMLVNATLIVDSIPEGMVLIALEDITERERNSEALQSKNAELISNNKQLESFTLAASNNLLEPIRKIYMFGKKIMDNETGLSDSGNHNLKRLLNTAVNMNQLIEDLINYSKINFTEKKFKKTDLNVIVKKAVNDLKPIIKENNAVIIADPLPPLNIIPWQIHLLFAHLISNAVKYSKQDNKESEIRISADFPEEEEFTAIDMDPYTDYVKISVSDNGKGFNKDFEKLIFDPFYKLQSDEKSYGTGLGLTLVQKIVWNHKGFIKALSSPGEGTAIEIYLPLENSLLKNYSEN